MDGRKKILDLLAKGELTAQEAENFLQIYETYEHNKKQNKEQAFRRLEIRIMKQDEKKVHISIPLEFIGLLKTSKLYHKLTKYQLDVDHIISLIQSGFIGTILKMENEDDEHILVYVE